MRIQLFMIYRPKQSRKGIAGPNRPKGMEIWITKNRRIEIFGIAGTSQQVKHVKNVRIDSRHQYYFLKTILNYKSSVSNLSSSYTLFWSTMHLQHNVTMYKIISYSSNHFKLNFNNLFLFSYRNESLMTLDITTTTSSMSKPHG